MKDVCTVVYITLLCVFSHDTDLSCKDEDENFEKHTQNPASERKVYSFLFLLTQYIHTTATSHQATDSEFTSNPRYEQT
jgi:hypothetical protein